MKIQLALDRMSIEKAKDVISETEASIDIVEMGTSLLKDFGLNGLDELRKTYKGPLLVDLKTVDEAEYEFSQVYRHGADIATAMGVTTPETLEICQQVASQFHRSFMIDTIGMSLEKINTLVQYPNAIICVHLSHDSAGSVKDIADDFLTQSTLSNRLAISGGISVENIEYLNDKGFDIAVIGSGITGNDSPGNTAKKIRELLTDERLS